MGTLRGGRGKKGLEGRRRQNWGELEGLAEGRISQKTESTESERNGQSS